MAGLTPYKQRLQEQIIKEISISNPDGSNIAISIANNQAVHFTMYTPHGDIEYTLDNAQGMIKVKRNTKFEPFEGELAQALANL